MVRAAAADREAQGHGLQRSRLIARELEPLDMGREIRRVTPNPFRHAPRPFGQEIAQSFAASDLPEEG